MTNDMHEELKPCPFCGSLSEMVCDRSVFARQDYPEYPGQLHGFRVECAGLCHAMTCWWQTEDEAIGNWNRRATLSAARPEPPAVSLGKKWLCALCGGDHDNDLCTDICRTCEAQEPWKDDTPTIEAVSAEAARRLSDLAAQADAYDKGWEDAWEAAACVADEEAKQWVNTLNPDCSTTSGALDYGRRQGAQSAAAAIRRASQEPRGA